MSPLLLFVTAVGPALILLWYFWSRDLYPEPRAVVLKTFALGALACLPIIPLASALELLGAGAHGRWAHALAAAFLGAAIPEELFKFLVLRLWVWRQPAFDEPFDGVVYGATASLGFAALENLLYVGEGGLLVGVMRALTTVPGHALTGALMGAYFGAAKFGPPARANRQLVVGLGAAVLLHGAFDALLLSRSAWALLGLGVLGAELLWARAVVERMRAAQEAGAGGPVTGS